MTPEEISEHLENYPDDIVSRLLTAAERAKTHGLVAVSELFSEAAKTINNLRNGY